MCVRWDGHATRSDLQGLDRTQVQIQGRGPGPARKKDALEAARPSPIPSRYGWRRARWGGRSPATGRFGTPLVETLLGGHHCPWPCHSSGRAEAPRGGLLGGPGPLLAAGEAAFSGLWTRMTLAGAGGSCRRTQTRPPCSAYATPMSSLCASMPAPSPESERLEGLPHRTPLALNTGPGGQRERHLLSGSPVPCHLQSLLLWGGRRGLSPHQLQDQPPVLEKWLLGPSEPGQ